jgi:hypothetical protein
MNRHERLVRLQILNAIHNLRVVSNHRSSLSLYYFVKWLSNEMKTVRFREKLVDCQSMRNTEMFLTAMEQRLAVKLNKQYCQLSYNVAQQIERSSDRVFDTLRRLLSTIREHRSTVERAHRSSQPSTSAQCELVESKPIVIGVDDKPARRAPADDDQSSDTSHSSFGDDVLMKVARDAYERRQHP